MGFGDFLTAGVAGYQKQREVEAKDAAARRLEEDYQQQKRDRENMETAVTQIGETLPGGRGIPISLPPPKPAGARAPTPATLGNVAVRMNVPAAAAQAGIAVPPQAGGPGAPTEVAPIVAEAPRAPTKAAEFDPVNAPVSTTQTLSELERLTTQYRLLAKGGEEGRKAAMALLPQVNDAAMRQGLQDIFDTAKAGGVPMLVEKWNANSDMDIKVQQVEGGNWLVVDDDGDPLFGGQPVGEDQIVAFAQDSFKKAGGAFYQDWVAKDRERYDNDRKTTAYVGAQDANAAESRARAEAIPTQVKNEGRRVDIAARATEIDAARVAVQNNIATLEADYNKTRNETARIALEDAINERNRMQRVESALRVSDPLLDGDSLTGDVAALGQKYGKVITNADGEQSLVNPFSDALDKRRAAWLQRVAPYKDKLAIVTGPDGRNYYQLKSDPTRITRNLDTAIAAVSKK